MSSQTVLGLPEVRRGSWDTTQGLRSAPDRAEPPPQVLQALYADFQDQAAVYAAIRRTPGLTQRALFQQLVPVMARKRVQAAVDAGVRSGWLVESPGSRGARTWRTVESPQYDARMVEVLISVLEDLQATGALVGPYHRHRLGLLARGVVRNEVHHAGSISAPEDGT